jgi:hypothetical protein
VVLLQWSGGATTQISFKANSARTALPCYEGKKEERSSRYHMIASMVQLCRLDRCHDQWFRNIFFLSQKSGVGSMMLNYFTFCSPPQCTPNAYAISVASIINFLRDRYPSLILAGCTLASLLFDTPSLAVHQRLQPMNLPIAPNTNCRPACFLGSHLDTW